jgi:hypothetical protein
MTTAVFSGTTRKTVLTIAVVKIANLL